MTDDGVIEYELTCLAVGGAPAISTGTTTTV